MIIFPSDDPKNTLADYLSLDTLRISSKYSYEGNILIDMSRNPQGQILIDIPHFSIQSGILFSKLFCAQIAFMLSKRYDGSFTTSLDLSSISCKQEITSDGGLLVPKKFNAFHLNNSGFQNKLNTFQALYFISSEFHDSEFLQQIEDTFTQMLKDVKHESLQIYIK